MTFKTFASPIALAAAAALMLGSAAFAQTMVGDQEISDEDLATVTNHCAILAEDGVADGMATDDTAVDDTATDDAAAEDTVSPDAGEVVDDSMPTDDSMAAESDVTAELELDAITLEDCEAAGLGV